MLPDRFSILVWCGVGLAVIWVVLSCAFDTVGWPLGTPALAGPAVALYGGLILIARFDERGGIALPILVVVSLLPWSCCLFSPLASLSISSPSVADAIAIVLCVGIIYGLLIGFVNRNPVTLWPFGFGTLLGVAIALLWPDLPPGSLVRSLDPYAVLFAPLHLGIASSLAWGALIVRRHAVREESRLCLRCGYDITTIDDGPCPECGGSRDESEVTPL